MRNENIIYNENCLSGLPKLPQNTVDCCVTSPPYFGLRDYGTQEQIGQENTPELYINNLVQVFNEVKRVLKPEGTLWLNIADSYAKKSFNGLKQKDLIGIPWMLAFALRQNGWYLRQDIIWNKPNPMPESVTDRCTKSHEYIFLLSKSNRYYFNQEAIRVPLKDISIARLAQNIQNQKGSTRVPGKTNGNMKAVRKNSNSTPNMASSGSINHDGKSGYFDSEGNLLVRDTANKKSVWTVTTKPFKGAHFATFPEDLIDNCIKAGSPEQGLVLDPFMGACTTAVVAKKLSRNYIGYELNQSYINIGLERLKNIK